MGTNTSNFLVASGICQKCVMSALLFNLAIDWVMRKNTEDKARRIRWTLYSTIEDLDYADDLALLSHMHLQEKTNRLQHFRQQSGLEINNNETNVMPINANKPEEITIQGQVLDNTDNFTYLYHNGETSKDIQNRNYKAQTTFIRLNPNWKIQSIYHQNETFNTTLWCRYGAHTSCLHKIIHIFWPKTI